MSRRFSDTPSHWLALVPLAWLAGCATTQIDAQWSDAQLTSGRSLQAQKVLVACDAYEAVVRQLCQDQLTAEVVARGATPVAGPEPTPTSPWKPATPDQYVTAARSHGAGAILTATVTPGLATVKPGLSVGFGLGSFGSSVGGGVGVSAPVGGGKVESSYSADSRLTDVASGRLMWTAKVTTPPATDIPAQMSELAKGIGKAIEKAGLL